MLSGELQNFAGIKISRVELYFGD